MSEGSRQGTPSVERPVHTQRSAGRLTDCVPAKHDGTVHQTSRCVLRCLSWSFRSSRRYWPTSSLLQAGFLGSRIKTVKLGPGAILFCPLAGTGRSVATFAISSSRSGDSPPYTGATLARLGSAAAGPFMSADCCPVRSSHIHTGQAHEGAMIGRIASLRAARAETRQLLRMLGEVVPPRLGGEATSQTLKVKLTRRLASLDRAIAEWEGATMRLL
jgi:hypothetical protein